MTPVLSTGKRGLRKITRLPPPTPLCLGTNRHRLISCKAFRVVPAPSWSWAGAGCGQWALTLRAQPEATPRTSGIKRNSNLT